MPNPLGIATKGKGFLPMLARGRVIVSRYGLTSDKMNVALARLADIVRQYNCSATIPITASALASNPSAAIKLHNQGQELAIHGYHHLDYSMLNHDKQYEHLQRAIQIFRQTGVTATGFRSPYLRWNADVLTALKESGFKYDSSQALAWDIVQDFETDAYQRVLGFYRAQSARDYPALPRLVDGLVCIPYCLPDDEALVERLRLPEANTMTEIWLAMLDQTYQAGELFTLGLHPERISLCQKALREVLKKARTLSPCVWISRLDEIAAWFLALGKTNFEIRHESGDLFNIRINAPARATILIRSLEVFTSTQPWVQGYRSVLTPKFTFRSQKRPVIGISPASPVSLHCFLRHHGYLVETSADPQACTCYLNHSTFHEEDERSLITQLEREYTPLVRLSRWPEGARSGLAITGDVDAFTIWDYTRRILSG